MAKTPWLSTLGMLAALLAGCALVSPEIDRLEQFKQWANEGRHERICNATLDCDARSDVCAQQQLIHGMACYRQAKQGESALGNFQTAISDLSGGLATARAIETEEARDPSYGAALLESLRERRDLETSFEAALPYNQRLTETATRYRGDFKFQQAGYYYGAAAALWSAQRAFVAQSDVELGCAKVAEAQQHLVNAASLTGELSETVDKTLKTARAEREESC